MLWALFVARSAVDYAVIASISNCATAKHNRINAALLCTAINMTDMWLHQTVSAACRSAQEVNIANCVTVHAQKDHCSSLRNCTGGEHDELRCCSCTLGLLQQLQKRTGGEHGQLRNGHANYSSTFTMYCNQHDRHVFASGALLRC